MATFFTSDLHFGHRNIIAFCQRPFGSVDHMDKALVENWNAEVKPDDTVWILGDVSFSTPERTVEILGQLNGKLKLLLGNHDTRFGKNPALRAFFSEIHDGIVEIKIDGIHSVLCHYPMMSWNRSFHGAFHLHGHTHGLIPFDPKYRRLDVGVDVQNFKPISWEAIVEKLAAIPAPCDMASK